MRKAGFVTAAIFLPRRMRDGSTFWLTAVDDDELPQTSDAVLIMVQYETALAAFANRYQRTVKNELKHHIRNVWITEQLTLENGEKFDT